MSILIGTCIVLFMRSPNSNLEFFESHMAWKKTKTLFLKVFASKCV